MNNSNLAHPTFNLEGKQFLIVDDDPIVRMVMNSMFKKWQNTTIEMVNDGSQALEKLQKSYFDLIILDLHMPVLNGYQTAKAIREGVCGDFNRNIPIIAVTADLSDIGKTQTEFMDNVLIKPFDNESLHTAIHGCLFSEMRMSMDAS
ncbi:response regulator [uncultured Cyclobacterium sp.]|uniref:response regulator n=1 Tax=uncultured Cyclobacterium sp. TaxID=453820 RepID=UPI0030EBEC52|tara:strand:- start:22414 stop:22854 length:441 start_codon:yes stop_codon:yes gene_type:complete